MIQIITIIDYHGAVGIQYHSMIINYDHNYFEILRHVVPIKQLIFMAPIVATKRHVVPDGANWRQLAPRGAN